MSKSLVTKLFLGSLVAVVGGILVAGFAVVAAFANGAFVLEGQEVVGINSSPFFWTMVALMIVGGLTMVGGAIGQFIAWIGALMNTARLDDKVWFILLLVLGLFSFGFIAMLIYVLVGPDGTQPVVRQAPVIHAPAA